MSARLLFAFAFIGALAAPAAARWNSPPPAPESDPLYAIHPPSLYYHNVGLLQMMVTNIGVFGNPFVTNVHGAGWKGGEYLHAASLWIGAVAGDNLAHVSTGIGYAGARLPETELLPPIDESYTMFESYEGMAGGNRIGYSWDAGDDDGDGRVNEDFLNGRDDDGDGRIDEDYEAISQQMFSCEYWDNVPEADDNSPDHQPLNVHILQRSFAWSDASCGEFIGVDYRIVNEGWETLRDVYLGCFVDSDAGDRSADGFWTDDGAALARIDTVYFDPSIDHQCTDPDGTWHDCRYPELHLEVPYMFDWPGSASGGIATDDLAEDQRGYFGALCLGHQTDPRGERAPKRVGVHGLAFFSGSGSYPQGDPANDFQRYALLSDSTRADAPLMRCGDHRFCFSVGPFSEWHPGDTLDFQVAFVIGEGLHGLRHNAVLARRIFDGQWRDLDEHPLTGCDGRETCLHIEPGAEPLFWKDPCDPDARLEGPFKNTDCIDPLVWRDTDCNCCTPAQGHPCRGTESLVHWVGSIAPPPPRTNLETPELRQIEDLTGDREIHLEWDNASELVPDPFTGRFLFCGYRIWRVEGWHRASGAIGPGYDQWQLLATLTASPRGGELDLDDFTDHGIAPIGSVSGHDGLMREQYPVGRYFFVDREGLKNGMLYFYDVVAFSCWIDEDGVPRTLEAQPSAQESDGVTPRWGNAAEEDWRARMIVVPNPWNGALWDMEPTAADPTGTKIAFARLPDRDCVVRIYTLAGDLIRELRSEGQGTVFWNMLSRNGQDVASGVYLHVVDCAGERKVGRFTIIR